MVNSTSTASLAALFPPGNYRLQMRFQRGQPADFFRPGPAAAGVLAERHRWLQDARESCLRISGEAGPLIGEAWEMARLWGIGVPDGVPPTAEARWGWLGAALETDLLLLNRDGNGDLRLRAGCVCFPSSWSLAEKMGARLEEIHDVVPGLNDQLGASISGFLERMAPDLAWLRANWGLSRSADLNQHPERRLPRLDAGATLDQAWLRVEDQALVALPRTRGVLFGIRITVHALAELGRDRTLALGLARALETMPEEMAAYKGIAAARLPLAAQLTRPWA